MGRTWPHVAGHRPPAVALAVADALLVVAARPARAAAPAAVLAAVLAVCLAAAVPFASTLNSYFLADDFGLIQLFSDKPPLHFLSLFSRPWVEGIYGEAPDELRPIVGVSYQIDALWGAAS